MIVARPEIAMRMRHVILTESYDRRIQGPAGLGCKDLSLIYESGFVG